MPREVQIKYVCDCGAYHGYKSGETYQPENWLTALPSTSGAGNILGAEVQTVKSLPPNCYEDKDRLFFAGTDCFGRWLDQKLFPVPTPEPVKATENEDEIPGG